MFKLPWSVHFQQESIKMRKLSKRMYQVTEGLKNTAGP